MLSGDDARERATFPSLAATLALPASPAGPKNRLRSVARIETAHGVYFLNWMTMVRMCLEMGIDELRAGQTTYVTKCRLGCTLERSWIYFRHRTPAYNFMCRLLKTLFAIDRIDPDLKALGKQAPYRRSPQESDVSGQSNQPPADERQHVMSVRGQ